MISSAIHSPINDQINDLTQEFCNATNLKYINPLIISFSGEEHAPRHDYKVETRYQLLNNVDPLIEKTRNLIQSILQKPSQIDNVAVDKLFKQIQSTSKHVICWQDAFTESQSDTEKAGLYADKAKELEDLSRQLRAFCPKEDVQASTSLSNDDLRESFIG